MGATRPTRAICPASHPASTGDNVLGDVEVVYTGSANDRLAGDGSSEEFHGGGGNDFIDGNDGSDTLVGDLGADDLFGGDGGGGTLRTTALE
jgi:Ca2+-binding RTX toxin-like protein